MTKTILVLAANPSETPRLRLDQEVREIANGLQRAKRRDEFTLIQVWAPRPIDIRRAMLDNTPDIVHFCGHGGGADGIAFEDEAGNTKWVDSDTIAGFFQLFADEIECVVLNACYSEVQATALAKHIPYVIGMKKAIGDAAAIEFAVAFYDALGAGGAIEFAYKLACNAIRWVGISEHLTPVLKKSDSPIGKLEVGCSTLDSHRVMYKDKEYIYIPIGPFTMGSNRSHVYGLDNPDNFEAFTNECPAHMVHLAGYYISRYPVTNAEYQIFTKATNRAIPYRDDEVSRQYNWDPITRMYPVGKGDHPVVLVSWHDAQSYCHWIGGRLPTEAEWEKAARGDDAREWPWGNIWQEGRCNSGSSGTSEPTPVGQYSPRGDSPYGVGDMAGNVWEWCSSMLDPYPYKADDGREISNALGNRVLRGGSFGLNQFRVRCASRNSAHPDDYGFSVGFRVVLPYPLAKDWT